MAILACAGVLQSCQRQVKAEVAPAIVETQWTRSAAERAEGLTNAALKDDPRRGGLKYALPRLRVYDGDGRLVYLLDPTRGWTPQTIGRAIDKAVASGSTIAGPSLKETLADLQTAEGRPASSVVAGGTPLVFDYWASWCVPCKALEEALRQWQASKLPGAVQIVEAEADPMKLAKEHGEKVFMIRRDSGGKMHKTPVL